MASGYERISFEQLYSNQWVAVEVHAIRHPNGVSGEHVLIVPPLACAAVIVDEDDFLFTKQARFGAKQEVIEIVKGGAETGETPLQCVSRETREELGVVAEKWEPLGLAYEVPSIMDSPVLLFVASEIYHVDAENEAQETVELVRVSKKNAYAAVASGEINDGITGLALLRYGLISGDLLPA